MASADIVLHCCSTAYPYCCPATRLLCCPAAFPLPSAPEPSLSRTPANIQSVPALGVSGDITPVLASGVQANIYLLYFFVYIFLKIWYCFTWNNKLTLALVAWNPHSGPLLTMLKVFDRWMAFYLLKHVGTILHKTMWHLKVLFRI